MTAFVDQLNAMQPLRYAAQLAWGHTPLNEEQAAHLEDYHSDPHPGKLAILGDRLQEEAGDDAHKYLAGQLLTRAGDGEATTFDHPDYTAHSLNMNAVRVAAGSRDNKPRWAAEVVLHAPGQLPVSATVPASKEELQSIFQWNHDHAAHDHVRDSYYREMAALQAAPDEAFLWHHLASQTEEPHRLSRDVALQYAAAHSTPSDYRLSEDQQRLFDAYLDHPHPQRLQILGDHILDHASDPHHELIGTLLTRLPLTGEHRYTRLSRDGEAPYSISAYPESFPLRAGDRYKWGAELRINSPSHVSYVQVPASREELQQLYRNEYSDPDADFSGTGQDLAWPTAKFHADDATPEEPTKMSRNDDDDDELSLDQGDTVGLDHDVSESPSWRADHDARHPIGWIAPNGEWHPLGHGEFHRDVAKRLGFDGPEEAHAAGYMHVNTYQGETTGYHPQGEHTSLAVAKLKKLAAPIGAQAIVNKVVGGQHREFKLKMQRDAAPIQFAATKTKQRLVAHPLLRGTRLELALRSIATDKSLGDAAVLAKAALLKPLDGVVFHALKDSLIERDHPLADRYNWEEVQHKLLLDDHLLRGLKPIVNSIWNQHEALDGQSFGSRRQVAFHALHDARTRPGDSSARHGDATGSYQRPGLPSIRQQLLAHAHRVYPTLDESQFDESLARLHAKVTRSMHDADSTPESREWRRSVERRKALRDRDENAAAERALHSPGDADDTVFGDPSVYGDESSQRAVEAERAQHFARGTPSVGGVKNALRLLRSDNQQRNREVAATVMERLGLSRVKLRDAVTSTRSPVAGVVAAIYHTTENGEEAANKAAAWIGHLSSLPSVSAFHIDPNGNDSLYQLDLPLDPVKAAAYLESHGISRAILSPQRNSTSVLIHDPGNKQRDRVEKAAIGANVTEVRHSVGRTTSFGSDAQNPRADAAARKSYRDAING